MLFSEANVCGVSSGGDGISHRTSGAVNPKCSSVHSSVTCSCSGSSLGKGENALFVADAISGSRRASDRVSCSGDAWMPRYRLYGCS